MLKISLISKEVFIREICVYYVGNIVPEAGPFAPSLLRTGLLAPPVVLVSHRCLSRTSATGLPTVTPLCTCNRGFVMGFDSQNCQDVFN